MKIVYSDNHSQHAPVKYFASGRMSNYPDVVTRMTSVLNALQGTQHQIQAPTDHGLEPIYQIHKKQYVDFLKVAYKEWVERGGDPNGVIPDTYASRLDSLYQDICLKSDNIFIKAGMFIFDSAAVIAERTFEAAYEGVQVALSTTDLVLGGERVAFALTRPPGHHSLEQQAGGFCFFNNAAIAAQYLITKTQKRVCVFDVDYHHGNGTQTCFYSRQNPLFVSIHGANDYPFFWGSADETGHGEGLGYNVNFPLPKGTDDKRYLETLDVAIEKHIITYKPDYLVVSLGVDTYYADPVGTFDLSQECFIEIGKRIAKIGCPTVLIMEGGYNVDELGTSVVNFLQGFESQ
jgi:acetoin utilization deacetylase AcuC-like enzyme